MALPNQQYELLKNAVIKKYGITISVYDEFTKEELTDDEYAKFSKIRDIITIDYINKNTCFKICNYLNNQFTLNYHIKAEDAERPYDLGIRLYECNNEQEIIAECIKYSIKIFKKEI